MQNYDQRARRSKLASDNMLKVHARPLHKGCQARGGRADQNGEAPNANLSNSISQTKILRVEVPGNLPLRWWISPLETR